MMDKLNAQADENDAIMDSLLKEMTEFIVFLQVSTILQSFWNPSRSKPVSRLHRRHNGGDTAGRRTHNLQ